ncbi:MAG: hypothetical protein PHH49_00540 [Candidatus Omnitrophica bacterium]|nr:hypothetical protein [Candidatus Omnitrophota bacterium]MDD5487439.1 hypothetical protein [Candidatus Omnitrophota bacterium]
MEKPLRVMPPSVINLFFIIGILSALAFRALIIVNYMAPRYVRTVWYAGAIGYMLFFLYRFCITMRRKRVIKGRDIIRKVREGVPLSGEERKIAEFLLTSISRSREDLNYLFIFILSIVAIVADIILRHMFGI